MAADPLMSLDVERFGTVAVLTLAGECDMSEAPRLAAKLKELAGWATVVQLEMSGLEFFDSSGLQVLYRASTDLASRRSRLILVAPTPALRRVLNISGLEAHFEICDRLQDLVAPDLTESPDAVPDAQAGGFLRDGRYASPASALGEGATAMRALDNTRRQAG